MKRYFSSGPMNLYLSSGEIDLLVCLLSRMLSPNSDNARKSLLKVCSLGLCSSFAAATVIFLLAGFFF